MKLAPTSQWMVLLWGIGQMQQASRLSFAGAKQLNRQGNQG